MKRSPALRKLSDDHHQGLVLALKAKKAAAGHGELGVDSLWEEVLERFGRELEPHFRIEEKYLAPFLAQHGETGLLTRLEADHTELRQLANSAVHNAENLARFGELLQQHIRFEERELFETAQRILDRAALDAIDMACRHNQA